MRNITIFVIAVVAIVIAKGSFYTVHEGEQIVITEFGRAVGQPIASAGIHVKTPFVQNVHRFDKRILEWNGLPNQITTKDKRFIWLDTTARWKITDALAFFQSLTNENVAQSRLDDIIDSAARDLITGQLLVEVVRNSNRILQIDTTALSKSDQTNLAEIESIQVGRGKIAKMILEKAQQNLSADFGIELVDVQIKHINYVQEVQQKVFLRMTSEREQIAAKYRSEGEGEAAEINGKSQKELERIKSNAYKTAEQIKGQADAEAIRIYADAHNRNVEFFAFLETLKTYKKTIGSNSKLFLTTDSDLYKYLKNANEKSTTPP